MKKLKLSKEEAHALLEYIAMEDCMAKRNMETLCAKEIKKYLDWVDKKGKKHGLSQEQVLVQIIKS
jgi:hypothetical protein